MKKFFRLVMVLVLTGATLAYTGCTDYSKDLDELSNRIDKLETGSIKSVEAQIESLKSTVASLETAKAVAENAIKSLQDENSLTRTNVDALKSELATLKAELAKATANGATKDEVYALVSQISSLETEITRLKDQLAKAATQDEVNALAAKIVAGEKALAALNESLAKQIAAINTALEGKATVEQVAELVKQITALETELKTMVTVETYEAKVAELEKLIAEATKMIPTEDVETLKKDMASVIEFVTMANEWILNASYSINQLLADVDLLKETVETLKEAKIQMDEAITNLKSQVDSNEEVLGVVAANLKQLLEEDFPAVLDDIKDLQSECALLNEGIVNLNGKIEALNLDIAAIQTDCYNIWNAIYEIENSGYLTEYDVRRLGYVKYAELTTATDALWTALEGYATQAFLEANYVKKEDLSSYVKEADLSAKVQVIVNNALEGHYSNTEIDSKVSALKSEIDAIKGRLDVTEKDIEALAKRIQSIAYVPEFADGAKAHVYKVGTATKSEYTTATFKVSPVECADVFSATSSIDVDGSAVPAIKVYYTNDLSAAECHEVPADKIVVNSVDAKTGLVTVTVLQDLSNKAMALAYESNTKGWGEDNTGSYITSDFAPVDPTAVEFNILDNIRLYNGTAEYPAAGSNKEVAWDKYATDEAVVAPYAAYAPYVKEGDKYYTVDEFLAAHYIDANIPFKYEATATYSDTEAKKGIVVAPTPNASTGAMTVSALKDVKFNLGGTTITKASDLIAYVGKSATVTLKVEVGTTTVVSATTASYKIVNRQVNYDLTPAAEVIPWTYKFAHEHSTAHSAGNYLDKALEFAEVDFENQNMDPAEFTTMLGSASTVTTSVKKGNVTTAIDNDDFKVTALTSVLHKTAKVELKKYEFGNAAELTHTYIKKYTVNSVATDYNVTYSVTFGPKPANKEIDLGSMVVPYSSVGYNTVRFTGELPTDQLYTAIGGDATSGFTSKEAFKNEFFSSSTTVAPASFVTRGSNPEVATSQWTLLKISAASEAITISTNADMQNLQDKFRFENTYTTWWGPVYTFKAKATVSLPNYTLSYVNTWADANGNVDVPGHVEGGVYKINNAKLHTYVKVNEASNPGSGDKLKVEYLVTTTADATKGIANVPAAPVASAVTLANNSIADAVLAWDTYTARELDLEAVLYIVNDAGTKKIELDRKPLHLTTKQILSMTSADFVKPRTGNAEVSSTFWKSLTVNSTLDSDANGDPLNLVNQNSNKLRPAYETKYGLNVEFRDVKVWIGQIDMTSEYSTDNYAVDLNVYLPGTTTPNPDYGKVTLKSNEAVLLQPVTITATAVLTYDRDYNHKDALTTTVSVTFIQQ